MDLFVRAPSVALPAAATWLGRLVREHWLFGLALLAGAIVRAVTMLGYPPIRWTPDSWTYLGVALRLQPDQVRPSGYPVMLRLLRPFHSLVLVAGVQHAMGLGIGIAVYALLRHRFRVPGWGATLAAAPVLLSAYQIQIEHLLLSDMLFTVLVTAAVVGVLWWPIPPTWMWALAGLLLAAADLTRSAGLPLLLAFVAYLASRFRGWQSLAAVLAMSAAFAVPLLGYAQWFDNTHGRFELTSSTGAFLYSRVIPFADCTRIKPPADEQRLCLQVPVSKRRYAEYYVWHPSSPVRHIPGGEFGNRANRIATDFAIRAIKTQPLEYLTAVWHDTWQSFRPHRDANPQGQSQNYYIFRTSMPRLPHMVFIHGGYVDQDAYSYNRADPNPRVVQPYAGWMLAYQRFVVIPGPLLGVIALTGLVGLAFAWRRFGGPTLLPWLSGAVLIVTPAATACFDARYLIPAIPLLCIAAATGIMEIVNFVQSARSAAGTPEAS
jgi:hypothetical protein